MFVKKFIGATIGSASVKLVTVAFGFISTTILGKILSPLNLGIFAFFISLIQILSMVSRFGLKTITIRQVASCIKTEEYSLVRGLWNFTWAGIIGLSMLISVVALTILILCIGNYAPSQEATLFYALSALPMISIVPVLGAFNIGSGNVIIGQIPELMIRPIVFVILLVYFFYGTAAVNANPETAMQIYLVSWVVAFLAAIFFSKKTVNKFPQKSKNYDLNNWLKSGIAFLFVDCVDVLWAHIDIVMLTVLIGSKYSGVYRVAQQFSLLMLFALTAINIVIAPKIAELIGHGEQKLQKLLNNASWITTIYTIGVLFAIIFFGKIAIENLFSLEYLNAYQPLVILAIGHLVAALTGPVGVLVNMTNKEGINLKITSLSLILNILLNLLLIPHYKEIGAAIATTLSVVMRNLLLTIYVIRNYEVYPSIMYSYGYSRK